MKIHATSAILGQKYIEYEQFETTYLSDYILSVVLSICLYTKKINEKALDYLSYLKRRGRDKKKKVLSFLLLYAFKKPWSKILGVIFDYTALLTFDLTTGIPF